MLVINIINNDVLAAIKTLKKMVPKELVKESRLKSVFNTKAEKRKLTISNIIKRKIESRQSEICVNKSQKSTPLRIYTDYKKNDFLVRNNFQTSDFVFFKKNDTRNTYAKKEISLTDADQIA